MHIFKISLAVVFLHIPFFVLSQQAKRYTISGYVFEKGSKEYLPGANVYVPKLNMGITSNNFGFYSITLPADTMELLISYIGYQTITKRINLQADTSFDIPLEQQSQLKEITVTATNNQKISENVQMSKIDIPVEQIKKLPALGGEKDVMKVLQLLPGVQKGSEGSSGLYVRGGGPDQNLIILDDATVYNANHLFGFFSLFNGDALKSIELTKGGFPARYGGRLSSVIDMQMKDGDKEKIHGEVGLGLIASRFTLEGPIKKNKASFLISARRTYVDLLLKPLMKNRDNQVGYFFYDMNAKLNYNLNYKNKIYLSTYFGKDKFSMMHLAVDDNQETTTGKNNIHWGNATATMRWNHLINEKMFSNVSLVFTDFLFDIGFKNESPKEVTTLHYFSGIRDYSIKGDIDFYPNAKHAVKMGIIGTYHYFRPNAVVFKGTEPSKNMDKITRINTYETAIYGEDNCKVSDKLRINAGLRLSNFNVRTTSYVNPEPRISVKYALRNDLSIKASYALMNQYLHLLSNSGIGLPSDLWVPATDKIKPQASQQAAIGLAKDLKVKTNDFLISAEGYYKKSKHIIGYKEGASFISINNTSSTAADFTYEDVVTSGRSESYGAEFFIQKKTGKFTGWIGYTLSWTWLTFEDLNAGKRFPARYDRRHDISLVGIYKLNDHISLSAVWVYGTGNAITMPVGSYQIAPPASPYTTVTPSASAIQHGYTPSLSYYPVYDYNGINNMRMPAYHRLDIAVQFHKQKKKYERVFEVGIYNVYNRHNPFFYQQEIDHRKKTVQLLQVSLFPVLPSVSWSWKF